MPSSKATEPVSVDVMLSMIATSCSSRPHALDWSNNQQINEGTTPGMIVFGSSNTVCLMNPPVNEQCRPAEIVSTFCAHDKEVTCVKYMKQLKSGSNPIVLSCSAEGVCVVSELGKDSRLHRKHILKGHGSTVTFACGIQINPSDSVVVTASADSTMKIWWIDQNCSEEVQDCQTVDLNNGLCLCSDITFLEDENGDVLLASSSQDSFVRLWRISKESDSNLHSQNLIESSQVIAVKSKMFEISGANEGNKKKYSVKLDALLIGHEAAVYSVKWHPGGELKLLTSSMDKSLILWSQDAQTGIWLEQARMGEVGGEVGGYYGAVFNPDGKSVLGHSYQGGLHLWTWNETEATWTPQPIPSGHFKGVEDVCWEPGGQFFMSCSRDQTVRIYAPWKLGKTRITHQEIGRPQIHGYDLKCLCVLDRTRFVSGAEEKIVRAFRAPNSFMETFCRLTESDVEKVFAGQEGVGDSACVPLLGLSNKAEFQAQNSVTYQGPPTENRLLQETLWPEVHKLYGHGYELFSVASNNKGTVLASACKSSKPEHAAILLWDTSDWSLKGKLVSHGLTVTELRFSPCDKFLLSVSRDRTWSLFQCTEDGFDWKRLGCSDKKTGVHSRIIYGCAWSGDSKYFFTASRDRKVVAWKLDPELESNEPTGPVRNCSSPMECADSVHSVDVTPGFLCVERMRTYLLAVGCECGDIIIFTWNEDLGFKQLKHLQKSDAHNGTVNRVRFRPKIGGWGVDEDKKDRVLLVSAGEDNTVKVHSLVMNLNFS